MVDDAPTTRRYPRSTREAFADERVQWCEPPEGHRLPPLWAGLLAGAVVLAVAVVMFL